jgi:hypothetical protein
VSTPLRWDEDGFARGVPYHDGALDGVVTDGAARQVHLAIRSTTGERRVLTLRGVLGLRVDGFREGNIVLNIRRVPAAALAADDDMRHLVTEHLSLDATALPPTVMLLVLESSFGAHVIAACHDVDCSDPDARLVVAPPLSHPPGGGSA